MAPNWVFDHFGVCSTAAAAVSLRDVEHRDYIKQGHVLPALPCCPAAFTLPYFCVQVNLDFNDDDENRVLLLVHDTKPPFLAGQVLSGKATGVVLPLKDPTSDMAVIARWG